MGGLRAGGVGAGTEMRNGTGLPARRTGAATENGHQPSSPSYWYGSGGAASVSISSYRRGRYPVAFDEAADAVCPDRRVLRRWAWVLDSGLRRNDERVGLAVGGLRAGGVGAGTEMRKGTDLPARYAGTEAENGTSPPACRTGTAAEDSRQRLNFVVPAKAGTQCGV